MSQCGIASSSAGFVTSVTGTANQIVITGTATAPIVALASNIYVSGISFDSGTNVLSAYAAGTFTPTITGSVSNPTVSYGNQVGAYEKIGTKVIINGRIVASTISGGSGNVQASGLPFTSLNSANAVSTFSLLIGNSTFGASVSYYTGTVPINSAFMIGEGIVSAGSVVDLAVSALASNATIQYAGAYNI